MKNFTHITSRIITILVFFIVIVVFVWLGLTARNINDRMNLIQMGEEVKRANQAEEDAMLDYKGCLEEQARLMQGCLSTK